MADPVQQSDESGVTGRVKELLKDIYTHIDNESEDQKRRLLSVLEFWRQGDRRRHPRKRRSMSTTYIVQDRSFMGNITNICTGGVFIETSESFPIGQEITLTLSSPERDQPINMNGQVIWSDLKGIGVIFTTRSKDLEKIIASL